MPLLTKNVNYLKLAGSIFTLFAFFLVHPGFTQAADMTSGPADAPVCVNGTAGTSYTFTYQGNGGDIGAKASINFGGATYYSSGYDGTAQSVYVSHAYLWATPGTYWFYGIGPSYSSYNNPCYNTGCPGSAGGGAGGGLLTGPNGSATGGPAFCKAVITASPPAQPDLVAGSITPTSATAGVAVTMNATIANTGTGPTGTGFTDLFQSATDASGSNATTIGTYSNPVRAANTSNPATLSYTFPSAGTYYVRACADSANQITNESNEGNNCGAWTQVRVSLNVSCSVPDSAVVNTSVPWYAFVSGDSGSGTSSYAWQYSGHHFVRIGNCADSGNTCPALDSACSAAQSGDTCWTGDWSCNDSLGYVESYTCEPSGSGSQPSYTYSWTGTDGLSGSTQSVSKTYSTAGVKQGTVTVTGSTGSTGTGTCQVTVTDAPSTLKVCQNSCGSGVQRGNTSSTQSFTMAKGATQNLVACYNTASGCTDATGDVTASTTWGENSGSNVVSLGGSNPKTVTANSAGTEGISATYSGQTANMSVNVTCVPTVTCANSGQGTNYCKTQSYTVDNGCGTSITCSGDKSCDYNWKEVAP